MKMNNKKVYIEIERLKKIADYYEFPVAVFFTDKKLWKQNKDKTRMKELEKIKEKYERIKEIINDN